MEEHIELQLKRLGKKKIKTVGFQVDQRPETLQQLIESCVKSEVTRYNQNREQPVLSGFLTPQEIQEQSETGKVTFGDLAPAERAEASKAIADALQAFKDGSFSVFIDDREIKTLTEKLSVQRESTIMFVRLTFLTGTYW